MPQNELQITRLVEMRIRFANRMNPELNAENLEQIPPEVLEFMTHMDYEDLVKPFIAEDIKSGASRDQAAIKYCVAPGFCRGIGELYGYLPRK